MTAPALDDRDTIADHERWVCVHGHFYQPPRENPWLDAIEPQPSARPYPDWNARITAECYRPNASARIVDGQGRIVRIVDNYARMSFNVGPTLMSWFEREAPDVHAALVAADRASRDRFGGHGSAMAQAYNHLIMPLASPRDRRTQVRWGVADFVHRFGRAPEGMWLPECAVDTPTLEDLAAAGIAFTVLAPRQASRVRAPGGAWIDVRDGSVDPGRVYRCRLPSGRSIDLYFYDGGTSQAVAFERLLSDGNKFVDRLLARPRGVADPAHPTLCHIATDGETYGHHHRYGDMALAWALTTIDRGLKIGARLTNYAEFRARFPATWEAEIVENSSWSCAHGVERWRADCGCSAGHPGWRQTWRAPLRAALDDLRDRAAEVFVRAAAPLPHDPWAARDAYIDVILDRSPERIAAFVATHARGAATEADVVRILELCELQRHAMLMYTSCGWFFDELSGIETVQVLAYAARVCELAERIGGAPIEPAFVARLAEAPSNVERYRDGRGVWEQLVVPSRVDLTKVVAHHAVSAAVAPTQGDAPGRERVYCYELAPREVRVRRAGKARLVAGTVRATSEITREHADLTFAALHLGEAHVTGAVRAAADGDGRAVEGLVAALGDALASGDVAAARQAIERAIGPAALSLASLFGRERDRAIDRLLEASLRDAEAAFARIYDEHGPLMRYLVTLGIEVPETFRDAAELVLRHRVLAAIRREPPGFDEIRACIAEAADVQVRLDVPEVAYAAGEALHRMLDRFARSEDDRDQLEELARMAEIASRMESPVDLWHAQNACVALRDGRLPAWRHAAAAGDAAGARQVAAFARLCAAVRVYVEAGGPDG